MSRKVNLGQIVPNIQIGTTTTGAPGSSASVENVGTALNPIFNFTIPKGDAGAIKMIIVNELPQTGQEDIIYLVPLVTPESQENRYAEYVYINNNWELLGKIGIQVDLDDYYTKQEVNNLIPTQLSELSDDGTHRLVSDSEKNTWNNKSDFSGNYDDLTNKPDLTDYVKNTDYATSDTGGVIKPANGYATNITNDGKLYANVLTYSQYINALNNAFISKGTLENVIAGKQLVNQTYVDNIVGDINTALDTINGEVI